MNVFNTHICVCQLFRFCSLHRQTWQDVPETEKVAHFFSKRRWSVSPSQGHRCGVSVISISSK